MPPMLGRRSSCSGYRELSGPLRRDARRGRHDPLAVGPDDQRHGHRSARPTHLKRRRRTPRGRDLHAGELGTSGAGLQDILAGRCRHAAAAVHRNPEPQVDEGVWLGTRPEVHAMMDLFGRSGLRPEAYPRPLGRRGRRSPSNRFRSPGADLRTAACGGEDYKLLLTAAPEAAGTPRR